MSNRKPFHELSRWAKKRRLQKLQGSSRMNTADEIVGQAFVDKLDNLGPSQPRTDDGLYSSQKLKRPPTRQCRPTEDALDVPDDRPSSEPDQNQSKRLEDYVDGFIDHQAYFLDSDTDNSDESDEELDLDREIASWAAQYNITMNALTSLLKILQKLHPQLPTDARTLLKCRSSLTIKDIDGGKFCYVGLQSGILSRLSELSLDDSDLITLQINIDGLPLFKSSNTQIWPILGLIRESKFKTPFVIGLFCGESKPKDLEQFLADFVADVSTAESEGIEINGKRYTINIACFICDAPARSFLKNIKSHNGYSACERCTQPGIFNGRMTFPETNCLPRTNLQFNEMLDEDHHHKINGIPVKTPLSSLKIGLVSDFVLDSMHLIYLGIMRRLIFFWTKGPLRCRQSAKLITDISTELVSLQRYMPAEFARKPRSLHEVDRWKAIEFRQFLIYYGPVVLKDKLSSKLYNNFMLMSSSVIMLLSSALCVDYCDYAEQMIQFFIETYKKIYGSEYMMYNVHSFTHIVDDVRRFGPLDGISAFPFENYLGQLKKLVRKPQHVITQIIRWLSEKDAHITALRMKAKAGCYNEHYGGPLLQGKQAMSQFKALYLSNFCIKVNDRDSCVVIDDSVCIVSNILFDSNAQTEYIVYSRFLHKEAFYSNPPFTSDLVGMFRVSLLSDELEMCSGSHIGNKCVLMPYKKDWVAVIMCHTML